MYRLAQPFYPGNEKLARKIAALEGRVAGKKDGGGTLDCVDEEAPSAIPPPVAPAAAKKQKNAHDDPQDDDSYHDADAFNPAEEEDADGSFVFRPKTRRPAAPSSKPTTTCKLTVFRDEPPTPRTQHLLRIINSRDVAQIRALKGVGAKKAEAIVGSLCDVMDGDGGTLVTDLVQLGALRGWVLRLWRI